MIVESIVKPKPVMSRTLTNVALAAITVASMVTGCNDSGAGSDIPGWTVSGPRYASAETQNIIEKLIAAHGGMEKWSSAPSVTYDNIFFNPYSDAAAGQDPWWVVNEQIEQGQRRVIQNWTVDEAILVFDGSETWTRGYEKGNAPTFMVHFFYYFTQLPWLTQDDGVALSTVGKGKLPLSSKEYYTVDLTYTKAPGPGKTKFDSFKLYIDPDTFLLAGYEYSVGYGAMVDALGVPTGQQTFGPMLRVHNDFATVDGLTVPTRMATWAPDHSQVYGHHVILNYSYDKPFDESKLTKPEGAIVDVPQPERRTSE